MSEQDEILQQDSAKDFVAPTTGQLEIEKPTERTRKSEIQANIDFWKDLAIEGIEINEDEIRAAIEALPEVEGFDWLIAIPKGVKTSELWKKTNGIGYSTSSERNEFDNHTFFAGDELDSLESPRQSQETFAVAARYSQEPDEDGLDGLDKSVHYGPKAKTAQNWRRNGKTYMTLLEATVAELRWHAQNGTHLSEEKDTVCVDSVHATWLGFNSTHYKVPTLSYSKGEKAISLGSSDIDIISSRSGVREVVTKDTEVDENGHILPKTPTQPPTYR